LQGDGTLAIYSSSSYNPQLVFSIDLDGVGDNIVGFL
jgi:hypothetical protein